MDTATSIYKATPVTIEFASKGCTVGHQEPRALPLEVESRSCRRSHPKRHARPALRWHARSQENEIADTSRQSEFEPACDRQHWHLQWRKVLHLLRVSCRRRNTQSSFAPRVSKGQHGPCVKTSKTCTRSVPRWAR